MRSSPRCLALALTLTAGTCAMLPTAAVAQTPVMLDLNPYSATTADSTPQNFAVLGSRVVFAASDNANGTELWITDGTTAGTQLLLDINTGTASSSPQNLTTFGSRVVFTATTVANGRELWITDGTAAGTTLVRDIRTGATGSTFSSAFGVVGTFGTPGSYISFGANDGVSGTEPWVTDGTNAGTIFLRDIAAGSTSSNASGFFAAPNGKVYFLANEGTSGILTGNELHATDGTPAGTVRVTDYAPGTASSGMSLDVAVGNFGFGPATLAATGQEPVAFDLTTNAVIALGDILPGSSSSLPQEFVAVGTEVFFRATTTGSDIRLYRVTYDGLGTPNGFAPVVDINTTGNDNVGNLAVMGGEVYFAATDGTSGRELWKSNGTIAGTVRVADINAGPGDSTPLGLIAVGSKVFFSATTPAGGREQYVTDGTAAGTFRLADLRLGQANGLAATPGQIGFGSGLLFAGSGTSIGLELFGTDGTVAGTALVKDIRPQTGNSASAPTSLVASGGRVYFSATDEGNGRELWSSDGTPAGTAVVLDTFPGVSGGTPSNGAPYGITPFLGGVLYASNNGTGAGQTGIEYYRATGGPGLPTAAIIANINPTTGSSAPGTINNIGVLNDVAYFSATDGVTGAELWKYDGISAPQQVQDLAPGSTSSFPANFAVLGNELYFQAGFIIAGGSGLELYRSNGSTITLVEDFNPGTTASSPAALFPFNGRLFMRATSPSIGVELVCYDPTLTTPDMYLVQDIRTGSSSSTPSNFLDFNGQLLFTATDALGNTQLYTATEATNSVTVKSTAIGSTATTLVKSGGYAYFAAGNLIGTNVELYAYSGTGNAFPIELNATAGSFPTNLTDVNGRLYFAAVGNSGGNELYRVVLNGSGVPTGAELVADLNSTGSSDPRNFRVLGNKLFFAANDGVNGEELWLLSTIVACTQSDVAGPGPTVGADGELTADDIIQFISWFTANNPLADIASPGPVAGADGELTADDIILFITRFTAGC